MNGMMMPMSTPNNTMPDMDGCSMAGMMMYFHTGNCEYILFESLKTTKAAEMGGACVVIFFLGVLYEGLKVFREYLLRRALTKNLSSSSKNGSYATGVAVIDGSSKNGSAPRAEFDIDGSKKSVGASMLSCSHFIQTLLHMLQVFISYCLMLVFMTYNAWLCIAIILGAGSGYFLFGWKRAVVVDVNEHCH